MGVAHDSLLGGHLGVKKTEYRTQTSFFWLGLQRMLPVSVGPVMFANFPTFYVFPTFLLFQLKYSNFFIFYCFNWNFPTFFYLLLLQLEFSNFFLSFIASIGIDLQPACCIKMFMC